MDIPKTMRALEIKSWDGPSAAHVVDAPVPTTGSGQLLLRVGAAAINFADTMQSRGRYPGGPTAPYLAGYEASGEVVAAGPDTSFQAGDQVIGFGRGAFADYMLVQDAMARPLPAGWTPTKGAALWTSWYTAAGALHHLGQVQAGETVLIHAAAGGVGQAAVRLAKHFGARVIATASSADKLAVAKQRGADVLVDYTKEDFVEAVKAATDGRGADLVLEMVGGETFRRNFEAVIPQGRIVVYGLSSGERASIDNHELVFEYPVKLMGLNMGKRPEYFAPLFGLIEELIGQGVIDPDEPQRHALEEVPSVLAALEARTTAGKQVFVP
ncbi:MAG: NADPH:quinone oxidoreductase family protein [Myxococcota bacterium]